MNAKSARAKRTLFVNTDSIRLPCLSRAADCFSGLQAINTSKLIGLPGNVEYHKRKGSTL
jgi:hypothetical protein